jgi:hypothetical protein
MVRRRVSAVSNHERPVLLQLSLDPSRRPLCGLLRMKGDKPMVYETFSARL